MIFFLPFFQCNFYVSFCLPPVAFISFFSLGFNPWCSAKCLLIFLARCFHLSLSKNMQTFSKQHPSHTSWEGWVDSFLFLCWAWCSLGFRIYSWYTFDDPYLSVRIKVLINFRRPELLHVKQCLDLNWHWCLLPLAIIMISVLAPPWPADINIASAYQPLNSLQCISPRGTN